MLGREHCTFGIITGVATGFALYNLKKFELNDITVFAALSAIGSLFPDIDLETSTLGNAFYPISKLINRLIGHRTYTHDILLNLIVMAITCFYFPSIALYGFWFGVFGHLLLDGITTNGLAFAYLFNKKRLHLIPRKLRVYSSAKSAVVITRLLAIIYIVVIFRYNEVLTYLDFI